MAANVIACVNAWNEEKLLPGCLESVQPHVDQIVVVDGRYRGFPGESVYSTDRTAEIALAHGAIVIRPPHSNRPWFDEATKRSAYLVGTDGDVYLNIDADEQLVTPLPRPEDMDGDVLGWQVKIVMQGDQSVRWMPRLFVHRGEMVYRYCHDALFSDGVLISSGKTAPRMPSVQLLHRQPLRDEQRRQARIHYYQTAYAVEAEWRQLLGM